MEEVKSEINEETTTQVETNNVGEVVVVKESIGKKVLKISLKVLAGAAALVAGVFIGRATSKNDDDSSDESSQTADDE